MKFECSRDLAFQRLRRFRVLGSPYAAKNRLRPTSTICIVEDSQGLKCFEGLKGFQGFESFNFFPGFNSSFQFATLLLFRVSRVYSFECLKGFKGFGGKSL